MGNKKRNLERRGDERRSFEAPRTIDVSDQQAMRFWSQRLGVPQEEIAEAVREVGPNSTAVALKLEAPQEERTAPPSPPLR
ncbi:DUF3606 domain-containing protein [Phenylobacterium sp. LjRoot219]|uniref:DUF3606 domain-containing protein n=1 Tax=Phenylobacterium sp. LjRoot219 TaxID=3342283 RepID=UPI003ECFCF4E